MPNQTFSKLLDSERIQLVLSATREAMRPIGSDGFELDEPELSVAGDDELQVLGGPVRFGARVRARASASPSGAEKDLFPDGVTVKPPAGKVFVDLVLAADTNASVARRGLPAFGSGEIGFQGSAAAGVEYVHTCTLTTETRRVEALAELVAGARLPGALDPTRLEDGEMHRFRGTFHLDLGIDATVGVHRELAADLFPGVGWPIRFEVEGAIKASLGLAIQDELDFSVGKLELRNPGWVRVRVARDRERRLTFGAMANLLLHYDLGSGNFSVLERLLDHSPYRRVHAALKEVAEATEPIRDGDWNAVESRLTDAATETLVKLSNVERLFRSTTGREALRRFADVADRIVRAYEGLDREIAGLWDDLLGHVALDEQGRFRRHLADIAALGDVEPAALVDRLLSDDLRRALQLFEMLSGRDLESLVVGELSAVTAARDRAARLARQALEFLGAVPDDVRETIETFARNHGIAGTVAWLSDHGTSPEALQEALQGKFEGSTRALVARIVGKAFDALGEDDLRRLQEWARTAERAFRDVDGFKDRLRRALEKLEGDLGFSLGLEVDRVCRTSNLVDVEFDPRETGCRDAFHRLETGALREFLKDLPEEDDGRPCSMIRDAVFVSRRLRTTAGSVLLRFLGLERKRKVARQRITESTIRVESGDGRVVRRGRHAGALAFDVEDGKTRWTTRVWLATDATGTGKDIRRAYAERTTAFRIEFTRNDPSTEPEELIDLDRFMVQAGFAPAWSLVGAGIHPKDETAMACTLELPAEAVASFLADLGDVGRSAAGLDADFRNAGSTWLNTRAVDHHWNDRQLGPILAEVVRSDAYEAVWRDEPRLAERTFSCGSAAKPIRVEPRLPLYHALMELAFARGKGPSILKKAGQAMPAAGAAATPKALDELSRRFVRGIARCTPSPGSFGSPLFPFWLIFARLARRDPASLAKARGIATWRWKQGDTWSEPLVLRLRGGLPQHRPGEPPFEIA